MRDSIGASELPERLSAPTGIPMVGVHAASLMHSHGL